MSTSPSYPWLLLPWLHLPLIHLSTSLYMLGSGTQTWSIPHPVDNEQPVWSLQPVPMAGYVKQFYNIQRITSEKKEIINYIPCKSVPEDWVFNEVQHCTCLSTRCSITNHNTWIIPSSPLMGHKNFEGIEQVKKSTICKIVSCPSCKNSSNDRKNPMRCWWIGKINPLLNIPKHGKNLCLALKPCDEFSCLLSTGDEDLSFRDLEIVSNNEVDLRQYSWKAY